MMTILRNRAAISQTLKEGEEGPRTHVPIAIIREIVLARANGWDSAKICKEYNVDSSVVQKLENHIAVPVDYEDGIVHSPFIAQANEREHGHEDEYLHITTPWHYNY